MMVGKQIEVQYDGAMSTANLTSDELSQLDGKAAAAYRQLTADIAGLQSQYNGLLVDIRAGNFQIENLVKVIAGVAAILSTNPDPDLLTMQAKFQAQLRAMRAEQETMAAAANQLPAILSTRRDALMALAAVLK
jgi:hypothetical protein